VAQARTTRPNVIVVRFWENTGNGLIARAAAVKTPAAAASDAILPEEIAENAFIELHNHRDPAASGPLHDYTSRRGNEIHYRVFAPVTERGHLSGYVEVNERLDNFPAIVRSFARTAALIALAAIVLMIFAVYGLFRFLVYYPMNELDEAMARVKAGSLDVRAPVSTKDEFGRLATGFNQMIERILELTWEREAQQENLRERVREATAESRAAAERYRLIFEGNPLPMWVYDAATLRFLTVNEAAVQNYGWTREEFLGMFVEDIIPAEDLTEERAQSQVNGGSSTEELERTVAARHRRKDGSLIDVEVLSHNLIFEGRPARLVIAADVTEKKRIEAGMVRSQRLEALGKLAGGIAHDLNNILSPLSISTFLLRSQVTDAGGRETLDTMDEVIERGSKLVKQVLSFARGAEGERVPLDPRRVLDEIVGILKETFPKFIRVRYNARTVSGTVLGDPTQLHQVLMNLCVNARDAMPQGGELEITAENLELDGQYAQMFSAKPGKYVMISVRDTGAGISPQVMDKIFDPFFTTKAQGTGLGLSTSLGIVRSHGGFINVYSEPGAGALFKVYLPVLDSVVEAAEHEREVEQPAGGGELILLVDDEEPIRRVTRGMLEASNYRVITAADGVEACALYREKGDEIKLVLTDMMMPVMDGAATISELRRLNPRLPIIASSGLAETGREVQARSLGVQKFLPKPYTAARLLRALNELLHG
ncbi:MAG: response regulator, partial [Blastocatellia bacterium]|nr:response regulator [Blastocatellia bacterium]